MTEATAVLIPGIFVAGLALVILHRIPQPVRQPSRRQLRLRDWMIQAGVPGITPLQLAGFCVVLGALVGAVLLGLSGSIWVGLAFAVLVAYLPIAMLKARQRRRSNELLEAWPDVIDNLASGIRAGLSLPEAVAALAERGPEVLRAPFARFANQYHATGRFGDALDHLKHDLADPTADRVVETLRIARAVGGSELGRTLRLLTAFLREQHSVRKEIEARQTWVVWAARMAFAAPWAVLLMLSTRGEAAAAYQDVQGGIVIAAGAVLATLGYWLMLRIGRLPREERVLR